MIIFTLYELQKQDIATCTERSRSAIKRKAIMVFDCAQTDIVTLNLMTLN